jgi:large subunit ribosomal protein L4
MTGQKGGTKMAKVAVYNMNGQEIGEIELNDSIFAIDVKEHLVHAAVVAHLANRRQGTQSAKTRAEVRGGGRKPWRQKGTGRARQGSIRAVQWKGGGVAFAPKPRDYSIKLNKKEKRIALKSVLTSRVNESKFIVLDTLELAEIKTKAMKTVLDALKLNKALIVTEGEASKNIMLSARNIESIKTSAVNNLNVYDILKYDTFVVTKEALNKIEEVYV